MDVKKAVRAAKSYVADLYEDEPIIHLGIEEVVFDELKNSWLVTVGFYRPWNKKPKSISELLSEPDKALTRSFKQVQINDNTGDIMSMTHRVIPGLG